MRGNLTTTALGAARAGQGRRRCSTAGARDRRLTAFLHTDRGLAESVCITHAEGLRVAAHGEMDLSAVALLMRYIVMSAQAEGAQQNDC